MWRYYKLFVPLIVSNRCYSFVQAPEDVDASQLSLWTCGVALMSADGDLTPVLAYMEVPRDVDTGRTPVLAFTEVPMGIDTDLPPVLALGGVPEDTGADLTPMLSSGMARGADLGRLLLGAQLFNT